MFATAATAAKGRALARDPRVVLCVDLERPPYAFVQVQGVAALSQDMAELCQVTSAIGGRYMGASRAEEFGKRNAVPGGAARPDPPDEGHRQLPHSRP